MTIDEICTELVNVAKAVAQQTNTHFARRHTTWTTYNEFQRLWFDAGMHYGHYTYDDISIDTDSLVSDDAIEFAWECETVWNERAAWWRKAFQSVEEATLDEFREMSTGIDADVDATLEGIAERLEDFIYAAEDYDEEVA